MRRHHPAIRLLALRRPVLIRLQHRRPVRRRRRGHSAVPDAALQAVLRLVPSPGTPAKALRSVPPLAALAVPLGADRPAPPAHVIEERVCV